MNIEIDTNETDLYSPIGEAIPAICIIDTFNIKVFTEKGEDFITSLQFQVQKIWTTKFGKRKPFLLFIAMFCFV